MAITFAPSVEPVIGESETHRPRVERLRFGDGYSVRASFGLNTVPRELALEWAGITRAQKDEIVAFVRARAGREAFLYTPPGQAEAVLWSCAGVTTTSIARAAYRVTLTLTEEFDLG